MSVVPLHRCICGKPGLPRVISCETDEETVKATFFSCDECMDKTEKFLAQMRPIFSAMIACGVPTDVANETMTFMLDKLPDEGIWVG